MPTAVPNPLFRASDIIPGALQEAQKAFALSYDNCDQKLGHYLQRIQQVQCKATSKAALEAILRHQQGVWQSPAQVKDGYTGKMQPNEPRKAFIDDVILNPTQFLDDRKIRDAYKGVAADSLPSLRTNLTVENKPIQELIKLGDTNATVTVLANPFTVGGAPFRSDAQEESLCQSTDLLLRMPRHYPNRKLPSDAPQEEHNMPVHSGLAMVGHSYRIDHVQLYDFEQGEIKAVAKQFNAVFVAAPNFKDQAIANYCNSDVGRTEYITYIAMLVRLQCEHALKAGSQTLYAGALGCGAFKNNPYLVAAIYRCVLSEAAYTKLNVTFAIHEPKHSNQLYCLNDIYNDVFKASPEKIQSILKTAKPHNPTAMKLQPALEPKLNDKLSNVRDKLLQFHQLADELSKQHKLDGSILQATANELTQQVRQLIHKLNMHESPLTDEDTNDLLQKLCDDAEQLIYSGHVTLNKKQYKVHDALTRHSTLKQLMLNILGCIATLGIGFIVGMRNYVKYDRFDIGLRLFRLETPGERVTEEVLESIRDLKIN